MAHIVEFDRNGNIIYRGMLSSSEILLYDQLIETLKQDIPQIEQDLKEQKSLEAGKPTSPVSFDFDRIWIFEKGYPRLVPRDSLDFFRDRSEYFILDLKTLFEPVVYDSSVYFPQKPEDAAKDTSAVRDTVKTSDENK